MIPVTHTDLLVVLAFTIVITIAGFIALGVMIINSQAMVKDVRRGTDELARMAKALAGLVYQEEEKTRALLREHGGP